MGLTGDFSKLAGLELRLKKLAGTDFYRAVQKNIGEGLLTQVRLGFRETRAPDGTPWAKLKSRQGKALQKTGRLRASYAWQVLPDGVRIFARAAYAKYHQYGTKGHRGGGRDAHGIPARPMLPSGSLPPAWRAAVKDSIDALRKALRNG